jgi:hypothetical protein
MAAVPKAHVLTGYYIVIRHISSGLLNPGAAVLGPPPLVLEN